MEGKGLIPKEQIESVVAATDLVALISSYTPLRPSGGNFLGLCPFHQEKSPSFVVSPSRGNYHCFGCGVHGNAIGFVMDLEHFAFTEAVEFLADRAGIRLERGASSSPNQGHGEVRGCLDLSLEYFRQNLIGAGSNSPIRQYLKKRDLSLELADRFALGWAPEGWTKLHDFLNQKGVPIKVQEAAGLIKTGEKGEWYDRLRDRLIFPIRDVQGRCLGFAGRIIGEGDPKYLNPPETEFYKKSSVFYGVFEGKEAIRKAKKAMVVEGYLDVIRLHERGFKHAIAVCGTALNGEHVKALKRQGIQEVELLFDGDNPGRAAALKASKVFLENEIDGRVAVLPDGLDPDDFFKQYTGANLTALLDEAPNDYHFLLAQAYEEVKDKGLSAQKARLDELIALAQGIGSKLKRDLFLGQIAKKFRLDLGTLRSKEPAKKPQVNLEQRVILPSKVDLKGASAEELRLMKYLIAQPQALGLVRGKLESQSFTNSHLQELLSRFLNLEDEEFGALEPQELPEVFKEYSSVLMQLIYSGNPFATEDFSAEKVQGLVLDLQKSAARRKLKGPLSPEEAEALAKAQAEARKKAKENCLPQGSSEANQHQG